MKQKLMPLILCILMITVPLSTMLPAVISEPTLPVPTFVGGNGTPGDPFQIANVTHLQAMNSNHTAHYILINDIDASDTSGWNWNNDHFDGFDPIGWNTGGQFLGSLDGQGFSVSNLYINRSSESYNGLIGLTGSGAVIQNVNVVEADITGYDACGMLVGRLSSNTFIYNCSSEGSVTATRDVGGLVGTTYDSTIENSYSEGTVTCLLNFNYAVGGLVGEAMGSSAFIYDCYSTADVDGGLNTGGLVGYNNNANIFRSYSTGQATGTGNVGGLVGLSDASPTVSDCYWDTETSGLLTSAGGTGKTTAEMYTQSTFTGWDFNVVGDGTIGNWMMAGYPHLQFETTSEITDVVELQLMEIDLGGDYRIMNDIDASDTILWNNGSGFYSIGSMITLGKLNGQGFSVDSLFINRPASDNIGLIATLSGAGAMVSNLSLTNADITGNNNVGGIAGSTISSTLDSCFVSGSISGSGNNLGGLIGTADASTMVEDCHTDITVAGGSGANTGGLIGQSLGTVSNCTASGYTSGTGQDIGGLIGEKEGNVTNCTSYGYTNSTTANVGGLIGYSISGAVTDCNSFGNVLGVASVGGLVGHHSGSLTDSNAYGDVTGTSTALTSSIGGLIGWINQASISNCTAHGDVVSAGGRSGGLIGSNTWITINGCSAYGDVTAAGSEIGGLVGQMAWASSQNSNAHGDVSGASRVGGLLGFNSGTAGGYTRHSNAYGNVTAGGKVGGLIGENQEASITNCTAWGIVNGSSNVGGLVGYNNDATVNSFTTTSNAHGDVIGTGNNVGGLMGYQSHGDMTHSNAYGDVTTQGNNVGGLAGNFNARNVNNCTAHGNVTGSNSVGGLLGFLPGYTLSQSSAHGSVTGVNNTGGLVGSSSGTITRCFTEGSVSGNNSVGGIVGTNDGDINTSFATGSVSGYSMVGGFVGLNSLNGFIENCYAHGDVSAINMTVGGFGGMNELTGGVINNSYSVGAASGDSLVGGFLGEPNGDSNNCFWDNQTSGHTTGNGATGMNTIDMMTQSIFTGAGWDFATIWGMFEHSTYPLLRFSGMFTPVHNLDTGENFTTIQEAIDDANTLNGHTIFVEAGTYVENVVVNKKLKIWGEDRDTTIIDGNLVDNAVLITANGTRFSGFQVINAGGFGYGIYVQADGCEIYDNIATDCVAGIYLSSEGTTVTQNHLYNNSWVGIRLWGSNNNTVSNNNASFNRQGINLYSSSTENNTILRNEFFNNSGNGIYLANANNNTFYKNNVSWSNYSIYFDSVCSGNRFYNNNFMDANINHVNDPAPAGNFYDNGLPDGGNYWDDYTGVDTDSDGIGDTLVPHPVANYDQYPWTNASGWNEPCVANNDTYNTDEDTVLIAVILENDTDPDPEDILVVLEINGLATIGVPTLLLSGALLTQEADGSFIYDTNGAFDYMSAGDHFIDNYTYMISDEKGSFDNATVIVNVTGVNDPPTAQVDGFTTDQNSNASGNVLADNGNTADSDLEGDTLTVSEVNGNGASIGSQTTLPSGALLTQEANGTFIYDPNGQFDYLTVGEQASDTFNYTLWDGTTGNDIGMVTITITGLNDAPTAVDDDPIVISEDSGANPIDVLANDDDPDTSDVLLITVTTQGTNGIVIITDGGTGLTYTPDANYFGNDTFTYTIDDGNGLTDTANVDLLISSVNDAPIITTTNTVTANQAVPYSVDYNATDTELDTLAWSLTSNATWLTIGATDGILAGTPTGAGIFSVNIEVDDNNGGLDWSNFTLTVTGNTTQAGTDTDGDGTPDDEDDFPNDANETTDTDGDGVGDNGDEFPNDATESSDTDGDGTGDNADAFPDDAAASVDADDDGKPDKWNEGYTADDSTTGLELDDAVDDTDDTDDTDDPADDDSNIWLYLIIILIIVGIVGAILFMKGSGKKRTEDLINEGSESPEEIEESDLEEEADLVEEASAEPSSSTESLDNGEDLTK